MENLIGDFKSQALQWRMSLPCPFHQHESHGPTWLQDGWELTSGLMLLLQKMRNFETSRGNKNRCHIMAAAVDLQFILRLSHLSLSHLNIDFEIFSTTNAGPLVSLQISRRKLMRWKEITPHGTR